MTGERIGRVLRALRHRRDWTQAEAGRRAGCSASVISRLEHGHLKACSLTTLERLVDALDGRLVVLIQWRGGELDRLLDADHAAIQEAWARRKLRLRPSLRSRPEVTYNHYGDRGSIDDLAFDPATGILLVAEIKTGIYDVGRTLAKMDEKERLAAALARRLGWQARRVVGCLVLAETRTNRRRVADHASQFARFDCRGHAAAAWLRDPTRPIGGLLIFEKLSSVRGAHGRQAGRQRVRHSRRRSSVDEVSSRAAEAPFGA